MRKTFCIGQGSVSVVVDINNRQLLKIPSGRVLKSVNNLLRIFSDRLFSRVNEVSMDMWKPFMESSQVACGNAKVVHDKFHVSKYPGEAAGQNRMQKSKKLLEKGDDKQEGILQFRLSVLGNSPESKSADFLSR